MRGERDHAREFATRPHPLFVLFFPARHYAWIAGVTAIAWFALLALRRVDIDPVAEATILRIGAAGLAIRFVWAVLQWATRSYGVEAGTDGELVFSAVGVLDCTRSEVRLGDVRNVVVDRPFVQRVLGVGSVGFATAGTGGFEVVWRVVGDPTGRAARVRAAGAEPGA